MKIKQKTDGDITVVELSGKVMGGPDHDKFKSAVTEMLEAGSRKFILISGFTSIKNAGGVMKVCSVNERVLSIFYISQLENVFEVFQTCEEARNSF